MNETLHVGLDVGSTTVKIIVMDKNKNTLYKNPQEHTYHLIVHQSQHTISEFNRVINLICSYLKPQKYTAGLQAFYEEHFQKIIRGNALQQLGKIT